ncbi:hypothetical protein [Mycolicibacterium helvum]|uniref:Uncharacterized protein n=1 Tax=Mycolicibacterium helvum TaxID=1534349 RepID=A0A7I7T3V9_9MYCO|nr:hypothetical protein [Mycolicibacterium helvum]BBY63650.1 hypothetical protein MHEL_18930 [Mycolicibacterium helvum]
MNILTKSVIGLAASAALTAALGDAGLPLTADAADAAFLPAAAESTAAALGVVTWEASSIAAVGSESFAGEDDRAAARPRGAVFAPVVPADGEVAVSGLLEESPRVGACDEPADDDRPEPAPAEFPEPFESAVATGNDTTEAPTPSATANTPTRPTQRA